MKTIWGLILMVAGIGCLVYVHALHPPHGVGDAVHMLVDRDGHYIKDPYYSVYMAMAAVATVAGAALFIAGLLKRKKGR